MDCGDVPFGPNTPLVFLTFLREQEYKTQELRWEIDSLGRELKLKLSQDINSNGPGSEVHDDGELETDGHFCTSLSGLLEDIQPLVGWQVNQAEAEAEARDVAEGLRMIADQLESRVVAQATDNLIKKLRRSSIKVWKSHLAWEVDWVLRQPPSMLELFPRERVIMALTLTLVKGVCEQAPRFLRSLFATALQYISAAPPR